MYVQETDLVRDSLHALQGLPSAVRKLERLASNFSESSANKSSPNLCTLWAGSVTATALGKVLSVVARAGRVRCQLEAFVAFFLDGRPDIWDLQRDDNAGLAKKGGKKKAKKRRGAKSGGTDLELVGTGNSGTGEGPSAETAVSPHCLVNQAFAAAVKTVLRGHSAALNTLAASVSLRRLHEITRGVNLRDKDPGPVIGYGCRDISLLEFYLHTRELRVQLQALAYICITRDRRALGGNRADDSRLESWPEVKTNRGDEEPGQWRNKKSSDKVKSSFNNFPKGAHLLTYLYDRLMEADHLHMELLRFLFERTYHPYSIFVRSWLYLAAVTDPYGEFVIEQNDFNGAFSSLSAGRNSSNESRSADLKLRQGITVPRFLEDVCTQLIRAGEQLQVLMKLAETSELAQQMGKSTYITELSEGPDLSLYSPTEYCRCPVSVETLVFSKKKLEETVKQREKKSKAMSEQFDSLFTGLASRRLQKETARNSTSPKTPKNGPIAVDITETADKQLPDGTDPDLQQEKTEDPPSSEIPGSLELSGVGDSGGSWSPAKFTGSIVNAAGDGPKSCSEVQIPTLKDVTNKTVVSPSVLAPIPSKISVPFVKKGKEAAKMISKDGIPDNHGTPADSQVPSEIQLHDPAQVDEGVESGANFSKVQSLISDHQRGTSWPLWGLPINPFLMPADVNDFTPNFYAYTSFAGTYHPWDVTTKLAGANLSSAQSAVLEKAARRWAETTVEPPWFTNLVLVLGNQLFQGLDAQLLLPRCEADVGLELQPGRWATQEHSDSGWNNQPLVELDVKCADSINLPLNVQSTVAEGLPPILHTMDEKVVEQELVKKQTTEDETTGACTPNTNLTDGMSLNDEDLPNLYIPIQDVPKSEWEEASEVSITPSMLGERVTSWGEKDASINGNTGLYALAIGAQGPAHLEVDISKTEAQPAVEEEENLHGAAKWVQYLRFSEKSSGCDAGQGRNEHDIDEEQGSGDEEIPLSVVVSKCIVDEILSQYECVSTLTVRLFQEGLCLQEHYSALRRYFLMEQGDWAEYFTAALCQNCTRDLYDLHGAYHHKSEVDDELLSGHVRGSQLRQMEVQGMLEAALQKSSCEGDEYAERLHICFNEPGVATSSSEAFPQGPTKRAAASFVDCSRIDAFDFIWLDYHVDWPLTLVLTSQSLRLYNVLFAFLMRIKLAVHALGDIWRRLQVIDRLLHKVRHSSHFQQQRSRFRTLQQFRQQINHLVTTVQCYVESKLLYVVWSKFLQDIQMEVNDMRDLETVHLTYLEDAINECFLSSSTQGVKGCIDSIMQCVLDFSSHMRNGLKSGHNEDLELIDDQFFAQVCQVNKKFQASLQLLSVYQMKQEPQYRTNLSDLWMILDFNSFLTHPLNPTSQ